MNRPPLSIIIPVYRRDCHKEVYAGSHLYPGEGVYLLKFDNSYSLWRSKTLYYRIYYSQQCIKFVLYELPTNITQYVIILFDFVLLNLNYIKFILIKSIMYEHKFK